MKKLILFIVVAFLTFGANATENAADTAVAQETKDKQVEKPSKPSSPTKPTSGIGDTITVYVADSVGPDALIKINDGANAPVLKYEKLPAPEKKWYETTWVVYLMMGMLIVALILAIMANLGGVDEKDVKRDMIKEIDDRIRQTSQSMSGSSSIHDLSINNLKKQTQELTDKMTAMCDEVEQLKQHQSSATTQQNAGNHQGFGEALRPKEVKLYATALDENTLMNVDTAKSSKHSFVISLKSNSDNEGTYEIINDQETQQRWLQNSDMQRCCVKVGNGNTIVSQVPGKVTVDRQSGKATITVKAKIYIK